MNEFQTLIFGVHLSHTKCTVVNGEENIFFSTVNELTQKIQ